MSNYNDAEIKELKVLYTKQGGVDTLYVNKMSFDSDSDKVLFHAVTAESDMVEVKPSDDKQSIMVTRKDRYSKEHAVIREYKIWGTYQRKENKPNHVTMYIEDLREHSDTATKIHRRRTTSSTERLLLNSTVMKNYALIAGCSPSEIDSLGIYKIKRFLSYRSDMLIYFNFISDFLMQKVTISADLYKCCEDEENFNSYTETITKHISTHIHEIVENQNNYVQNKKKKNKESHLSEADIKAIKELDKETLAKDVRKILIIMADLRHRLFHYEYAYFSDLFTGEESSVYGVKKKEHSLSTLLDLNMFKALSKISAIKEEKMTTYLSDDDCIRVLNKDKNAKKLYTLYNKICNRKNGFNKFINSFFTIDGQENPMFKAQIEEDFSNRLNFLKETLKTGKINNKKVQRRQLDGMRSELKEMEQIKEDIGSAYSWDIHLNPKYKELYNQRKTLVTRQSELIQSGSSSHKNEITDLNKQLLTLKKEMENITKLNARFRLKYKMQMAFGFLLTEYKFDLKTFGDKFNLAFDDFGLEYLSKGAVYLKAKSSIKGEFDMNKLEKRVNEMLNYSECIFKSVPENNLIKLYMLMYLLIPVEIRGDFLGFVKHHYYNLKNVDFVSDQVSDKSSFFHQLRLFEKNTKKYEIIHYEITEYGEFKENMNTILKSMGLESSIRLHQKVGSKDKRLFDKNIILPLVKYYQMVYKLANDAEVHGLVCLINDNDNNCKNMQSAMKDAIHDGYYNYGTLMRKACQFETVNGGRINKMVQLRNKISHHNVKELYSKPFSTNSKKDSLSQHLKNMIDGIDYVGLNKVDLGMNMVNDFYMSLDRFLFNMKKTSQVGNEYEKIYEVYEELNKIADKKNGLSNDDFSSIRSEANNLLAIYKKSAIIDIKKHLLEVFTKNETRYLKIYLYNKSSKEKLEYHLAFEKESNGYELSKDVDKYDSGTSEKSSISIDELPIPTPVVEGNNVSVSLPNGEKVKKALPASYLQRVNIIVE